MTSAIPLVGMPATPGSDVTFPFSSLTRAGAAGLLNRSVVSGSAIWQRGDGSPKAVTAVGTSITGPIAVAVVSGGWVITGNVQVTITHVMTSVTVPSGGIYLIPGTDVFLTFSALRPFSAGDVFFLSVLPSQQAAQSLPRYQLVFGGVFSVPALYFFLDDAFAPVLPPAYAQSLEAYAQSVGAIRLDGSIDTGALVAANAAAVAALGNPSDSIYRLIFDGYHWQIPLVDD